MILVLRELMSLLLDLFPLPVWLHPIVIFSRREENQTSHLISLLKRVLTPCLWDHFPIWSTADKSLPSWLTPVLLSPTFLL
jgi:hypothetical protein